MRNRIRSDAGADVPLKHFLAGSSAAEVAELILAQAVVRHMASADQPDGRAAADDDTEMETLTL
jgi:hypothetical protein